jgi:hypothetical protein
MTAAERWLPVVGFVGYEVSDHGRVRSWKPRRNCAPLPSEPRVLAQHTSRAGYKSCCLMSPRAGSA